MGRATSMQGHLWRYVPGLEAGAKPVHNGHLPVNIAHFGRIERVDRITIVHDGWQTLRSRLAKVALYQRLDPAGRYNFGVPYDEGLLFGYKREALKDLLREYRRRLAHHEARLPQDEQA